MRIFNEPLCNCIELLNNKLEENISTVDKQQTVNMDEMFILATLDMIAMTMFSVDLQVFYKKWQM